MSLVGSRTSDIRLFGGTVVRTCPNWDGGPSAPVYRYQVHYSDSKVGPYQAGFQFMPIVEKREDKLAEVPTVGR